MGKTGFPERLARHVNRKALDQFATFTDQRAELQRRQADNEAGEAKIRQLIDTLDLRKDEAIERTFKVRVLMTLLLDGGSWYAGRRLGPPCRW